MEILVRISQNLQILVQDTSWGDAWVQAFFAIGVIIIFIILGITLREKYNFYRSLRFVFLDVQMSKKESKEDREESRDQMTEIRRVIGVGEHFFNSLYGLFKEQWRYRILGQPFISLEYIAYEKHIHFIVGCDRRDINMIEKQINGFYPGANIEETEAPKMFHAGKHVATGYLSGNKKIHYPFKTHQQFESSDPINTILNNMSDLGNNDSSAGIQIMIRPHKNNWQKKARKLSQKLQENKKITWYNPLSIIGSIFEILFRGAENLDTKNENQGKSQDESQEMTKQMTEKADQVGFETIIRCVTSADYKNEAERYRDNLLDTFSQYGKLEGNEFKKKRWHNTRKLLKNYIFRLFKYSWSPQNKIILTPSELAAIYHFPHTKYNTSPNIKWQNYKIEKAPNNLPKEGVLIGHNHFRGEKQPVFIKNEDRFRHFYVIGQTGTGKSSVMQVMARQDLVNGNGFCIVDPHGSLIEDILPFVPKSRIDDVVIFDPSDTDRPVGLNILEAETEEEKDLVTADVTNMMIKIFDEEIFGPRIQDYFRNGCLTLMADPAGGALTDIVRLFTDDVFQQSKVKHVTNPIVRSFWDNQMAKTGAREKAEIIPYFAAKFGAFVTNKLMRNIIGQTKSGFDFSEAMQKKKILLMNLSKGKIGEFNSKLLGLIVVSKIQTATLRRENMNKGERKDFFLYIDEFQNYVIDSIESILSEARKYRLGMIVAHQYINQIDKSQEKKGVNLKDAIFGNVGSMMCYKIGAQDAEVIAKEMTPVFTEQDLINIDKYKAVMKLSIDTQPSRPFSIVPVNPYTEEGDRKKIEALKQISRLTYGRSKKFVDQEIIARLNI